MSSAPASASLEYAVVLFPNGEYSEVPAKWLVEANDGSYSCWWPKDKKCTSTQIKEKVEPDLETWEILGVTVDKFCSNYQSARKRAQDSSFSSAEEKVTRLGKGKRTKKAKRIFSSGEGKRKSVGTDESDSEENEFNLTMIPEFPDNLGMQPAEKQSGKEKRSNNKKYKQGEADNEIEVLSNLTSEEQPEAVNETINQSDKIQCTKEDTSFQMDDDFRKELRNMFAATKRMWADIKLQQQDVIKRLESLERRTSSLTSDDLDLIKIFLPLKTVEKVDEFNKKLKNEEYKCIFKKFVKQIGGSTSKDAINNTMAKVFRNKCARKYTWKGKNAKKPAAKDLLVLVFIKETLCVDHADLTEADFNSCASEWFRLANQRYIREKNKRNKVSENADQQQQ